MKNKLLPLFSVFFLLGSPLWNFAEEIGIGKDSGQWYTVIMDDCEYTPGDDGSLDVILKNIYGEYTSPDIDLMLGFEGENNQPWKEILGRYDVQETQFLFSAQEKVAGLSSGHFFRLGDRLVLKPRDFSWFKQNEDLGSFTIEFWIYPLLSFDNQIIVSKYGPVLLGNNATDMAGIQIVTKNNRVEFRFHNFFQQMKNATSPNQNSASGEFSSNISITSVNKIQTKAWNHVAVTFNEENGQLIYYLNGETERTVWCTSNGRPGSGVCIPRFYEHENSPVIIGQNWIGYLDNLIITKTCKTDFQLGPYHVDKGTVITKVMDLGEGHNQITSIEADTFRSPGTRISVEYRIASEIFRDNCPENLVPYKLIPTGQAILTNGNTGRYVQLRIQLFGTMDRKSSPVLKSVVLRYQKDFPPVTPVITSVVSENGNVIIQWKKNLEEDVVQYNIYYGKQMNNYLEEGSPLVINQRDLPDPNNPGWTIKHLQSNTVYYLSVTSVDKSGQESLFSREQVIEVLPVYEE